MKDQARGGAFIMTCQVTAIETSFFILTTRSAICQNAKDDAGSVRKGIQATESRGDSAMHPATFQLRHHQPSKQDPRLSCAFLTRLELYLLWALSTTSPCPKYGNTSESQISRDQKGEDGRADALHVSTESKTV